MHPVSWIRHPASLDELLAFEQCHIPSHCRRIAGKSGGECEERHGFPVDFLQKPDTRGGNHFQKVRWIFESQDQTRLEPFATVKLTSIDPHAGKEMIH